MGDPPVGSGQLRRLGWGGGWGLCPSWQLRRQAGSATAARRVAPAPTCPLQQVQEGLQPHTVLLLHAQHAVQHLQRADGEEGLAAKGAEVALGVPAGQHQRGDPAPTRRQGSTHGSPTAHGVPAGQHQRGDPAPTRQHPRGRHLQRSPAAPHVSFKMLRGAGGGVAPPGQPRAGRGEEGGVGATWQLGCSAGRRPEAAVRWAATSSADS